MKLTHTAAAAFIAIAAAAAPTMTFAQTCCAPAGNDWPEVNGNIGAWQYSSLNQINKSNINQLGPAWVVHVGTEPITVWGQFGSWLGNTDRPELQRVGNAIKAAIGNWKNKHGIAVPASQKPSH